LRMLASEALESGLVDKVSPETNRALLKKRDQAPATSTLVPCEGAKRRERRGDGRRASEDVPVLYEMPCDALSPMVCLDAKPVVLHAEMRASLPTSLGQVEPRDYAYERHSAVTGSPPGGLVACDRHCAAHQAGLCRAPALWFHATPRHGIWLNQAEIEIGIF